MDFDEEEWFYRSVKEYEDLFMYDLQTPANVISWIGEETVCISCSSPNDTKARSELLRLELPHKLTAGKDQGLTKDRDFKVTGGAFHSGFITGLKFLPQSRILLTTEDGQNLLRTWSLPETERGLFKEVQNFENVIPTSEASIAAVSKEEESCVAFGSHGNNICVLDLKVGAISYNTKGSRHNDQLCGVHWTDAHTFLACSTVSGQLWLVDTRQKDGSCREVSGATEKPGGPWCMDVSATNKVHLANTEGSVVLAGVKNGIHQAWETDLSCEGKSHIKPLSIQCSSSEEDTFSLSGGDGCVHVYRSPTPAADVTGRISASYVHQGHLANTCQTKVRVIHHTWHPRIPRFLISSADDGSLHAWQYAKR